MNVDMDMDLDLDTGEYDGEVQHYQADTAGSAVAYSAVPRQLQTTDVIPKATKTHNLLNADVYPDVSGDDYLTGRFHPPTSRS